MWIELVMPIYVEKLFIWALHVNIAIDYHLIFDNNITAESKISH